MCAFSCGGGGASTVRETNLTYLVHPDVREELVAFAEFFSILVAL